MPYASYNSVCFLAEQVSHHPPSELCDSRQDTSLPPLSLAVSGFYAECASKNMYVNGHLWTRSKFLGLSLGVHNIGTSWCM